MEWTNRQAFIDKAATMLKDGTEWPEIIALIPQYATNKNQLSFTKTQARRLMLDIEREAKAVESRYNQI